MSANYPISSIKAEAGGRPLRFDISGTTATGLLGFRSDARTGAETLSLQVVASRGGPALSERRFQVQLGAWPVEHIQMAESAAGLLAPAVLNAEWVLLQAIAGRVTPRRLWDGAFLRPVPGPVTSAFGTRRSYNDGPPGSPHEGSDFAAAVGEPVIAANSGVVVVADTWDVRGEVVGLDHGLGVFSGYYHLSERLVAVGEAVTKGQVIGRAGSTGLSTGPHLHWDVIAQGANMSPLEWTQRALP
ncbi:MAG: M23 family metallopeptidase [Dehalococcoidia bacterium]|nr:M23 family metallopeptidase [Dehalococcoidia bacterium]